MNPNHTAALASAFVEWRSHAQPKCPSTGTSAPKGALARHLDTRKIVVIVSKNPKRGKAAQRFALYTPGMSVAHYKKLVGTAQGAADLRWDAKHSFIRIEPC
jgi:hypothetical protein